uniref:hypothetical protein n=1 Tax=Arthrobacter sp. 18067 TaxID=2681413 RepID=UPI0013587B9A
TPRRQRPRAAGPRYTRHTIAQTAVVAFGMILIIAAGDRINGLFIAGFAIAYFGIYRIAKGVTRREAAHRADRREIRSVAELPGSEAAAA